VAVILRVAEKEGEMNHLENSNAFHKERRDTLSTWQTVVILLFLGALIVGLIGFSKHRNTEGKYQWHFAGKEI
jgi:maltodextrin utilization protein YvdJ